MPPTLSDGTFYITVYGAPPYSFSVQSANPIITDVPYFGTNVNSDLNRVGWRFYRVTDIAAQLGPLGWDLLLQNAPPGTEIALRRNAVPGRWNYRANNSTSINSSGHVDFSSVSGELQRPAHQADIWYVGVYNASAPLDAFTLIRQEPVPRLLAFDGISTVTNQSPGTWRYFRIDVPTNALGWDIRIKDVTSGDPHLVVRRDQLPDGLSSSSPSGSGWEPFKDTIWPSGWQWAAGEDWTRRISLRCR